MLVEGSAIDPEVLAERGVRSVRKRGAPLPPVYSRRQRGRGDGILFTVHRPNGETATIFRPDEPRPDKPGHKYEQEPKRRGGSGNVLDVPPSLHHLIGDTDVPVVFVEGIKKADAIATAARKIGMDLLVVAIAGVWNWVTGAYDEQGKKRKRRPGEPREPISDMFDVPVEGRRALICFDSDMLRKPEVQQAAEGLAGHLSGRGALVEVVYLEDQPDGSKTGADDFLAGEGTLREMLALARPYSPGDLQVERLRRDERLEAALGYLVGVFEGIAVKTSAECSLRSVFRVDLEMLERHGTLGADGIEAVIPAMDGAEMARISQPTFSKRMTNLEEMGLMRRIKAERPEHADSYVFLVPQGVKLYNNGTEAGGERNKSYTEVYRGYKELHPLPEVSWSSPGPRKRKRGVVPGTRRPRQGAPTGGPEPKRRPGKKRDEVLRHVVAGGGSATRGELLGRFGTEKTTWKDFKRNVLSELLGVRRQYKGIPLSVGPPVLELTDEGVRLVDTWEDAWEEHRVLSGEDEAARKRSRETLDKRMAWRLRHETPADPAPTEEEMAEGREARQKRRRAERLVHEGMAPRSAAREVLGAEGWIGELRPGEDLDPPPTYQEEHPLDCECLGCSVVTPGYARTAGR